MNNKIIRVALFASGSGSLLPGFFDLARKNQDFKIACLIMSRETPAIELAKQQDIPVEIFPEADEELITYLAKMEVNLICLAGYLKILSPDFIKKFELTGGNIINTHPSLLPKFGGHGMYGMKVHEMVAMSSEVETGFTVHKVIAEIDAGEIIAQVKTPIEEIRDPEKIRNSVLELEKKHYPEIALEFGRKTITRSSF